MDNTINKNIYIQRINMGFKFSKKIKYDMFIKNHTPESVYILGLLWADGTIRKKTNGFSLECVKEDIDYFYPIFLTTGEYGLYTRERIGRRIQKIIVGCSLELSRFLKENDYTNKSIMSPDKILLIIPENLKRYFFLGWSDGDGNFYLQERGNGKKGLNQYSISGSYKQNWNALIKKCEELNINYRIDRFITKLNHSYSSFRICRSSDIIKFGDYLYKGTEIGLKRKMNYFNRIKKYINDKPSIIIKCFNIEGDLVNEFKSLSLASLWISKNRNVSSDINDACVGRQKTAFGYKWKKLHIN
jgi:hypothetical protein